MYLIRVGKAGADEHLPFRRVPTGDGGGTELRVPADVFDQGRRDLRNALDDKIVGRCKVLSRATQGVQQDGDEEERSESHVGDTIPGGRVHSTCAVPVV